MTGSKPLFVEEVKERLKQLELSQTQFAKLLGMDQSTMSRALSGKRRFQLSEKVAVLDLLSKLEARLRPLGTIGVLRARTLRGKMLDSGYSAAEVASRSGIDESLIEAYIGDNAEVTDEHAEVLRTTLGWVLDSMHRSPTSPTSIDISNAIRPRMLARKVDDEITLYVAPDVIGAGYFRFVEERLGVVADLSVERLGQGAYGLYVPEYGLEPVFEAGHVLLLLPAKPVSIGGWAAVFLRDFRVVFGRIRKTDGEGVVVMLPAGDEVTVARSEVSRVHMFGGVWFG